MPVRGLEFYVNIIVTMRTCARVMRTYSPSYDFYVPSDLDAFARKHGHAISSSRVNGWGTVLPAAMACG